MQINVGIIGVTGYSGQELLKCLLKHAGIQITYLAARRLEKPTPIGEMLPHFRGVDLQIHPFKVQDAIKHCDVVFLALPHGTSMEVAPKLLKNNKVKVIDLSGDFRIQSKSVYERAYQLKHTQFAWAKKALYGLAEFNPAQDANVRLIANPGCYPTATLLALAPLMQHKLILPKGIVVDAKSGVSGAGKSLKEHLLFCEVHENFAPYKVNDHQHAPEIEQSLSTWQGGSASITFAPHLLPVNRGLTATCYASLKKAMTTKQARSLFEKNYKQSPFVRILPEGEWPQLKNVVHTNYCDIGLTVDTKKKQIIVISAIDNLVKGAAGQAVQNLNWMCDFPETEGLLP